MATNQKTRGGRRTGAGRKPIYEERMLLRKVAMPAELWAALDAMAAERGTTTPALLRDMATRRARRQKKI